MSPHELIVLGVIVAAVILFITEWIGIDLIALMIVAVLVLTGVITPQEGLSGFSDPATLTVAFMFVLSAALLRSGILRTIAPRLSDEMRKSETKGMLILMVSVAFLSAFLNNTPIVAVFIPIVVQAARSAGLSASRMLMPLSFATIMGGTTTLIGTSTNILVSGIATDHGLAPFTMFQMAPMGIVLAVAGIAYMLFFGRKQLRKDRDPTSLKERFGVKDYISEIELLPGAPSVGQQIMNSRLVKELQTDIIEIRRGEEVFTLPSGDMVLQANDMLKVRCEAAHARELNADRHIRIHPAGTASDLSGEKGKAGQQGTKLVELVITGNSPLDGKTIGEADLMRIYRAIPLAVRKREEVINQRMEDIVLRPGDVILAEVRSHYVERLRALDRAPESPFAILDEQEGTIGFDKRSAIITALVLLGVVLSSAFALLPIVVSTLVGVCLIVLTRCIPMEEIYDAIDWKIIFLMAGALSLGLAMTDTGLADRIAHGLTGLLGRWGPEAVLAGILICTVMLTEVMSNTATAALLAPIAISTAAALGVSPLPFLMAVTFAASASFMTPIGYQTNTMVYSAGRYKFTDFTRVGAPITFLFFLLAMLLLPVFYPF